MSRLLLLVCTCCLLLAACIPPHSTSLSNRLIAPGGVSPLLDSAHVETLMARLPTRSGRLPGEGGVPIFWRALDPGDYRLEYRYTGDPDGSALRQVAFDIGFSKPTNAVAPRGTVVLLHGWMMDGDSLMPWALQLAQAGYRTISLDLRNHGRSGSGPSGYGTREGQDVAQVVNELRTRGEIAGPLYLFGVSYGAATSVFAARALGDQVAGVVAMESFDNAGRGIRDMVPHMLSSRPDTWKTAATTLIAQATYGRQNLDAVIAAADAQLKLDLDAVDVASALRATPACVLIVHGANDHHIPVAHGRALATAAPRDAYLEVPGETHLSLPMRLDRLAPSVDQWFAETAVRTQTCPEVHPLTPALRAPMVALAR